MLFLCYQRICCENSELSAASNPVKKLGKLLCVHADLVLFSP